MEEKDFTFDYPEEKAFLNALKNSCIKTSRTKKPDGVEEWSYADEEFGCPPGPYFNILPGVVDQGERNVCHFCAVIAATKMELNTSYIRAGRGKCNIELDWESLLTKFFQLHGLPPENNDEERRIKMEEDLLTKGNTEYWLFDAAPWCLKHMGVTGHVKPGPANEEYTAEFVINDYTIYHTMSEDEVREYVEDGRALVASVLADSKFESLQKGEIYCWVPEKDEERNCWVDNPKLHSVVLMGDAKVGVEMDNEKYHPFLNSYGERFADGGVGSVFFKGIFLWYLLLEMDGTLKDDSLDWTKVKEGPMKVNSEIIPPSSPESTSSQQSLVEVTATQDPNEQILSQQSRDAPTVHIPPVPQGQVPSQQIRDRPSTELSTADHCAPAPLFVPPHRRPGYRAPAPSYVPPHLRRTTPGGRASMH